MIRFTQVVIKVGSGAGAVIPKKQLEHLNVKVGDEVSVVFRKPKKPKKQH